MMYRVLLLLCALVWGCGQAKPVPLAKPPAPSQDLVCTSILANGTPLEFNRALEPKTVAAVEVEGEWLNKPDRKLGPHDHIDFGVMTFKKNSKGQEVVFAFDQMKTKWVGKKFAAAGNLELPEKAGEYTIRVQMFVKMHQHEKETFLVRDTQIAIKGESDSKQ